MRLRYFAPLVLCFTLAGATQAQSYDTPQAVLEANIAATGGADAWQQVRTLRREGQMKVETPMGTMQDTYQETYQFPGYRRAEIRSNFGNNATINTPEKSWIQTDQGNEPMDEVHPLTTLALDGPNVERLLLDSDLISWMDVSRDEIGGIDAYRVRFRHDGTIYRRFYDAETLYLIAADQPGRNGTELYKYRDYREIEGLMFPFEVERKVTLRMSSGDDDAMDEQESTATATANYTAVAINPEVDPAIFGE